MDPAKHLYRVNIQSYDGNSFSCNLEVDPGHAILKGHFPGNPVVPGAMLIRALHDSLEMMTGTRLLMTEASQVKFLNPVIVSDRLSLGLDGVIAQVDNNGLLVTATISGPGSIFFKFKGTFLPA